MSHRENPAHRQPKLWPSLPHDRSSVAPRVPGGKPPGKGRRSSRSDFRFIDLFAGIGGLRLGFEAAGGRCVFTSEYNPFAQETYAANFRDNHEIFGDITAFADAHEAPDHDVLLAGFPCQPFSIAGVSKKNSLGRKHGFACDTQGTLFFEVVRFLDAKEPSAFLLENVKNLQSHDGGRTFSVIMRTLEELGYTVSYRIIDAQHFVPQHRERIVIVGFKSGIVFPWESVVLPRKGTIRMRDVLHPEDGSENAEPPYTLEPGGRVNDKYILSEKLWAYLQAYASKHKARGNGFGYGLVGPDDIARTLSARYYKDGSEILVDRGKGRPRRLTPRECARLMGYPDSFRIPVSDTQAYKQFGNSVAVPVFAEIARVMAPLIEMPAMRRGAA